MRVVLLSQSLKGFQRYIFYGLCYLVCYLGGGVDSNGRMYLMKRPDHAEIEARLWRLYLTADDEKEDYKNRLRFKVRYGYFIWF